MLKKSYLLKGIIALLALALVFGVGMAIHAIAAPKTLIVYVSENGDNTSGKDEVTAYQTIRDATTALSKMSLAPDTDVQIVIVDRTVSGTGYQVLDGVPVYDTKGNKLTLTVTSMNRSNPDDYGEWIGNYVNSSLQPGSQNARLVNNLILKDVKLVTEVSDKQLSDGQWYCQKDLYIQNCEVTFDNCIMTSTDPSRGNWREIDGKFLLASDPLYDSTTTNPTKITIRNCDFGHVAITGTSGNYCPNADLIIDIENSKVKDIFALRGKDPQVKNLSIRVHKSQINGPVYATYYGSATLPDYKGATLSGDCRMELTESTVNGNIYGINGNIAGDFVKIFDIEAPNSRVIGTFEGSVTIGGKMETTFLGGKYQCYAGIYGGENKTITVKGGIYNNFYGGTFEGYGAPVTCLVNEKNDVTVNADTFNTIQNGIDHNGAAPYFNSASGTRGIFLGGSNTVTTTNGTITNYFYGGQFGKAGLSSVAMIAGGDFEAYSKNVINAPSGNPAIVNYYGYNFTTDGMVYGGSIRGTVNGDIVNHYNGGTFNDQAYGGCSDAVQSGNITNYYTGATLGLRTFGASGGSDASAVSVDGNVTNHITGGTFTGTFYGGSYKGLITGSVTNNVSAAADGTEPALCTSDSVVTYNDRLGFCGGGFLGAVQKGVVNNISAGTFGINWNVGKVMLGSRSAAISNSDNGIAVQNNISGGHFLGELFAGNFDTDSVINGIIENNISGGVIDDTLALGGRSTKNNQYSIVNNISGGLFKGLAYAANAAPTVSHISDSSYHSVVVNNISGGVFEKDFFGTALTEPNTTSYGSYSFVGQVKNRITGGEFKGDVYLVSPHSTYTQATASDIRWIPEGIDLSDGVIVSEILGGTFHKKINDCKDATVSGDVSLTVAPTSNNITFTDSEPFASVADSTAFAIGGGEYSIVLDSDVSLRPFRIYNGGKINVMQLEAWTDGHQYISVPASAVAQVFVPSNDSSSVTGMATEEVSSDAICLVGASSGTAAAPILPELLDYSLILNDNIDIHFVVNKESVRSFVAAGNEWTIKASLGEKTVTRTFRTLTDVDAVDGADIVIVIDGVVSTDYDQAITFNITGRSEFSLTLYELLEKTIDSSSDATQVQLLKAIYNYGQQSENVFEGKNHQNKYSDIVYTDSYTGSPSQTTTAGYNFYGASLNFEEKVAMNYYMLIPEDVDPSDLTIKLFNENGQEVSDAIIVTKAIGGVASYNFVISAEVSIPDMNGVYTLKVMRGSNEVASCTNSITYCCASYIRNNSVFKPVSQALLALIEAANDYFA